MKPDTIHAARSTFLPPRSERAPVRTYRCGAGSFLLLLLLMMATRLSGQTNASPAPSSIAGRPERILVRPLPGVSLEALHKLHGARRLSRFPAIGGIEVLEVPPGANADALVKAYQQSGLVRYAEKDHIVHAQLKPNDPYFQNGTCWQLMNTGASGGTAGADIDAKDAWNTITSAAGVIVAVVDSGVRYTHQDLAPNMWHNPNQNTDGYSGDLYGINAITGSGNPWDDFGHGTHVAGIIGAVGNNGVGVVGVCWSVKLMALKFIDSKGNGSVSDAVTCIDYAISHYASVINFSWGDPSWNSQALYDAINAAGNAGVIFTAACGNLGANTDYSPYYPASYALGNLISVAATTRNDQLASYSSYGPNTVSLGAPGDTILSCWNSSDSSYQYLSGTSMAAPLVAGACALLRAEYPNESYGDIIHRIMWNVTSLPALSGRCVSGGRLNLQAAMQAGAPTPPPTVTVTASDNVATIGTSDTGAFTFTRSGDTSSGLTVNYQLGGTAVQWDDYRTPQGDMPVSIVIPAGSSSYTMIIDAIGNETGANPETVILTLSSNPSYNVGSPNSGAITIYPQTITLPTVTVTASDAVATINTSDTGAFTFTRTGDTSTNLTVNYQLGGTAVSWYDYRRPQGDMPLSLAIPAGSSATTMIIDALGNESGANPETVILTLSGDPSYTVGSPNSGTITIYPNRPPKIQTIAFSSPGNVTLTWSSISGASYQVQSTSAPEGSWQTVSGTITASGSITSWTGNVAGAREQFYRVTRTS